MVLGFQKEFKEHISNGSKIHTIRPDVNKRWKVGNFIHFATGVRTKAYNQFGEGLCKWVSDIELDLIKKEIKLNGSLVPKENLDTFANNDGFTDVESMCEWFQKKYPKNKDYFKGRLIGWTDFNVESYFVIN